MSQDGGADPRIQQILDLLLRLASGDLDARVVTSGRGDELDAILTGVGMLGEELSASFSRLTVARDDLEERVRVRTAELARANEQLRHELEERTRTELSLRKAQEQLSHSQKLEAIGRLAGGIAHDFNNVLSVINTLSKILMDDLTAGDPMREDLEEIHLAAQRAAALTRQLLTFSRRQVVLPVVTDLGVVVSGLGKMLGRLVGEDVEVVSDLAPDLWKTKVDPGQVEQAIVNLAVNARDAMPRGGRLTLRTANLEVEAGQAAELRLAPGNWVVLTVTDTGTGMDEEVRGHLFEPFFTTKERGKGTGLGLSTVYGVVQQSGGTIQVESAEGQGTCFRIFLPKTDENELDVACAAGTSMSSRGGETILVVEDDESVRRVVCRVLTRHGYVVLEASNPGEALLLCESHVGPIHLMLSDVVMPHLNGPVLAERLGAMRPTLKVIFMSGYTDERNSGLSALHPQAPFIQKPVDTEQLATKVREVLDAGPASRPSLSR